MKRKIKMFLYAAPGVGKSTFVSKAPNPLFLCTDGNFEWLGLPDKNHIQLNSYAQFKQVVTDILNGKYAEFDTICVDLVEDLNTWAMREFCVSKKIEHIGDYKSYGAGYDLIRKDYFAELSKLINYDANFIGLSHEVLKVEKDRKGTEHHKYYPHDSMNIDKLWSPLEGRVRYFLRAYMVPEEVDGKIRKVRYLSINPKENEFGIARGIDESNIPDDIKLDWDLFVKTIGIDDPTELLRDHSKDNLVTNTQTTTSTTHVLPTPKATNRTSQAQKELLDKLATTKKEVVEDIPTTSAVEPIKQDIPVTTVDKKDELVKKVAKSDVNKNNLAEVFINKSLEITGVVNTIPKVDVSNKSEEATKMESNPIASHEITDEQILEWLKAGLTVMQVENTYNIKLSQADKIRFVKLKVQAMNK